MKDPLRTTYFWLTLRSWLTFSIFISHGSSIRSLFLSRLPLCKHPPVFHEILGRHSTPVVILACLYYSGPPPESLSMRKSHTHFQISLSFSFSFFLGQCGCKNTQPLEDCHISLVYPPFNLIASQSSIFQAPPSKWTIQPCRTRRQPV